MSYKFVIPILLLIYSVSMASAQGSTITATNYTSSYANQTINQTLSYVNQVNQSAFLIFYPDLAQAYAYLDQAQQVASASPSSAVAYSNQAFSIAKQQYSRIGVYRSASLVIMLLLTTIFIVWLYLLMKPVGKVSKRK